MSRHQAPRGPIKARDGGDPMAPTHPKALRCTAKSKTSGGQCRQPAIPGGTVCRYHGGAAPQVKQAAMERLRALQHPAVDALEWLATQRDFPSAAYSAARDILDRTEGKAPESVAMTVTGTLDVVAILKQRHERHRHRDQ